MSVSRRQFLAVTLGALAGCQATNGIRSAPGQERVVDAGPANRYRADGVYSAFRDQGFFLVCRDGKLFALSAICTHKKCKVAAEPDHSFYCPCHGSTFDPEAMLPRDQPGAICRCCPPIRMKTGSCS